MIKIIKRLFFPLAIIFIGASFTGAYFSDSVSVSGNAFAAGTWMATPNIIINEDFNLQNPDFIYNGSAIRDAENGNVILTFNTEVGHGYSGNVFYKNPIEVKKFKASFDFFIGSDHPIGADGMAFAVISQDPHVIGNGGGGLGYGGLSGFAVEFDTHNNYGPDQFSDNHIGIDLNGDINSVYLTDLIPNIENNGFFHAEIYFDNGHVEIFLENLDIGYLETKIIDYNISGFTSYNGYFGFTGGVGAYNNFHKVDNFYLETF